MVRVQHDPKRRPSVGNRPGKLRRSANINDAGLHARPSAMAISAEVTADPLGVLRRAGEFLESDPVRHNVILTLLHGRVASPAEGRYVVAADGEDVVGVVFQSPLTYFASVTPMGDDGVKACVEALASEATSLPGVAGEAATAARFAGQWTETTKLAAIPEQGQRIYEAGPIAEPEGVPGEFRRAADDDKALLGEWLRAFNSEVHEQGGDPDAVVTRRVAKGEFWVWEDRGPVSMAALTEPVAGVARVQAVYTPPELRGRGYASACVARLSSNTARAGTRCILYTDLGNPVSNSVYRRIGYSAIAESLLYKFR